MKRKSNVARSALAVVLCALCVMWSAGCGVVPPVVSAAPSEAASAVPTPAQSAEPSPSPTASPAETPSPAASQAPSVPAAPEASPSASAVSESQTLAPSVTPAPSASAAPSASNGTITLHVFVQTDDEKPASKYAVQIDETTAVTNAEGAAQFTNITVAPNEDDVNGHPVTITGPAGESGANLFMYRGATTAIQDAAMGGTVGISVAQTAQNVYIRFQYEPEQASYIVAIGDTLAALQ